MGTEPADPGGPEGHGRGAAPLPVQPPVFDGGDEAPTESLVAGTMGDRCVNCGAPLTADQRYCVNCGERRGAPRFTLPTATATAAAGSSEPSEPVGSKRVRPRRPRASSGATLVAGVGTLLALGVGVLIGHGASGTKTVQAGRAQVITVNENGGGGGAQTSGASNSGSSSGGSNASKKSTGSGAKHKSGGAKHNSGGHKSKSSSAPPAPKPTKKEAHAAQSAANKVTGGGNVNNAPATVTVGGSCTGAGCNPKTHKFNGNFFGQ